MTWFTWRQFRAQAMITAAGLAVLGVLLLITVPTLTDMYADVAACQSDCANVIESFLSQLRRSTTGTLYYAAIAATYALPALIGVFWGAPLIARELEAGTHRLAWNQSVTRTRWLATKLIVVGGATALAAGLLSLAVTAWAQDIDSAAADRITPLVYGARGIVPIGYALFAFALGLTAGMLIRRTVAAMAATLAGYVTAAAAMPLWLRAHLTSPIHETKALDIDNLAGLMISGEAGGGGEMQVFGRDAANAWTVSNETITTTGEVFDGPADPSVCGRDAPPSACEDWLGGLGLRQDITYHPDSHFWTLQLIETGIFLALAALLAGFSFWWIRRRLS
jgi:ABC-type transport system involved in multi-copper enzyme maturation permease subunit